MAGCEGGIVRDDELKESYLFVCAICRHEQRAKPSIFMEMGINSGHGSCLACAAFLHLEIDGDVMVSREWEVWLAVKEVERPLRNNRGDCSGVQGTVH